MKSNLDFLGDGEEMGALMRSHDWSTSPLGEPVTWPQSLRSVVGLMLANKHVKFVAWGPELTFLYNDRYSPIFGAKHPWALGRPFREVWPEIWEEIEPLVNSAIGGEATWSEDLHLVLERNGYSEDCWFTFSYSPVRDESGGIAGLFCAGTETTQRVLADRRGAAEQERQRQMLLQMPGFVGMLSGPDLVFTYVNDAFVTISERTDFIGRRLRDVFADIEGQGYFDAFEEVLQTGKGRVIRGMELRLHGRDDTQYIDFVLEPIRDEEGVVTGVFVGGYEITEVYRTAAALRGSEAHLRLMINELNHRVKNSLATVQAIAAQTFRTADSFAHARTQFSARLFALAQAHDVLTEQNWSGASLAEVIRRSIEPHRGEAGDRFRLDGPPVCLTPKSALAMSMALHELCTNAAKYGALSNEGGRVDLVWTVDGDPGARRLQLRWKEVGGPLVEPPKHRGFGSRLIETGLAAELNGDVRIVYNSSGVVCTIVAPLPAD